MRKNAFAAKHVILFWYWVAKSATAAGSNDDNACFLGHKRNAMACLNCAAGYLSAEVLPSRQMQYQGHM
ncbi:hypothetical protein [Thalassospira sp. HF15]|uniref:hypothetical protein n=1 Tax=Thalassospira sp. HF15 TaxID=2722755 RepID=UPI0034C61BEC